MTYPRIPLPIRNSRIKLSQGQIFWREVGRGPIVVFLHGSWEDGSQWFPVIEQLGSEFHCLAPDLLGFGESASPKAHYSIGFEVECLAEYLEALKLRQIYLVGCSLGGWVAASYALEYPELVHGIVLLEPEGVQVKGLERRWQGARLLLHPLVFWSLRSLSPLAKLLNISKVNQLLQRRRQLLHFPTTCKLLFRRRWAEVKAEFLQERLTCLQAPVLILQGEQNNSEASSLSQTYAQLLPHAEVKRISQTGKNLTQTQPDAVAQFIREFVKKDKR
ncbi:MAG: alpha/beta hydrolase [Kovacikia sp.]